MSHSARTVPHIVIGCNRTATIWDAELGTQLLELKGHRNTVRSAAFNADGTRIVTASDDQTAKVWDAQTASSSSN